ncbi:MAG: MFS transporter [Rhizobiaceae bacterium]
MRITPRMAIMVVFAGFGAIVGAIAGSVPQLMAQSGLNNASYGIGITIMTATTVAAMGLSGTLARHYSHRTLLLVLLPATLVLLFLLLTGRSTTLFFVIAPLFGIAIGATDVIMNAEGGAIEVDLKRPVYTAFHGSVSLSVAFFAIISSLLSSNYGPWASVLASSSMVFIAMAMVYIAVPARELASLPDRKETTSAFSSFSLPITLIGLAAGLIIACEVTALLWSSELLAATAPELAAISGLGAAFFGLCNAMARFPGDRLRARFGDIPLMTATLGIAIIGFAGLGLTTSFAANVFFFALTGMGLAVLCPCLFAMASNQTPHNRAAGLSAAMLVAGVPRIIAPSLFGWIAEISSTRLAFGLCALVAMAAMATIQTLRVVTARG